MKSATDVISWIHSLLPFGVKPGLERMEWLLHHLHNPEKKIKAIHVGGTNGKGSTINFMKHMLMEAGYDVGTFTSPYIECFEERISINGEPISDEALIQCGNTIRPLVEEVAKTALGSPTEFEVITTMAFYYFAYIKKVDIVLLEVGLGGRFDSTNVVTPLFSVITSIGFDHMSILGNSIAEITKEKAGIIKENIPVVSGPSQKEAQQLIKKTANRKKAPYYQFRTDFNVKGLNSTESDQTFVYSTTEGEYIQATIEMKGPHQQENAALALFAISLLVHRYHFHISTENIVKGLQKANWHGRFERLSTDPLVVVDGAHNVEGMRALAQTLQQHYPNRMYRFVFAATEEKDMHTMLQPFVHMNAPFTFTSFHFFRAAEAKTLYDHAPVVNKRYDPNWERAIADELNALTKNEMLVICGSLYFIADVRKQWQTPQLQKKKTVRSR